MAERHRSSPTTSVRGAVGVVLVLALAGLLFASNARLSGGVDARQPQDLTHLVEAEIARAERLAADVAALREEVDRLTAAQGEPAPLGDPELAALTAFGAGGVPVEGPGLTVQLTDASPGAPRIDEVTNDDLVVHQQDLQGVVNALWAGGAEAMTLQGQRVVSTSAFRCVGNVLILHGQIYSPPYVVQAIGDPRRLRDALDASPTVQVYLQYVDLVGLGWEVSTEDRIEMPAAEADQELEHARASEGVPVVAGAAP